VALVGNDTAWGTLNDIVAVRSKAGKLGYRTGEYSCGKEIACSKAVIDCNGLDFANWIVERWEIMRFLA
jgi:hypothetical protein